MCPNHRSGPHFLQSEWSTPYSPSSSFWDSPLPNPIKKLPEYIEGRWDGSWSASRSSESFAKSVNLYADSTTSQKSSSTSDGRQDILDLGPKPSRALNGRTPGSSATPTKAIYILNGSATKPSAPLPVQPGLLAKQLGPSHSAKRNGGPELEQRQGGTTEPLGSWVHRKHVFPVQEPAEDVKFGKASKGSPWGASPSSVLPDVAQDLQDRSLASFIKTMYPNVQGRNVISTRKKVVPVAVGTPNAVHAAWVYRFRRQWAREQIKYHRGLQSPATPPNTSDSLDEVAAALVGWMEEVDLVEPHVTVT